MFEYQVDCHAGRPAMQGEHIRHSDTEGLPVL